MLSITDNIIFPLFLASSNDVMLVPLVSLIFILAT